MGLTREELHRRIAEIGPHAATIQGWLRDAEGASLYESVWQAPTPVVVELGSWKGRSTVWLASGVRDRGEGRVYAVDHWYGSKSEAHSRLLKDYGEDQLFQEFLANLDRLGLADVVTPVKSPTVAAARSWPEDRKIGLLFIDASHDYADVRRDFEYWSPFLAPGGLIAFHDMHSWPGPTRLVSELPGWFGHLRTTHTTWIGQKLT